MKGEKRRATSDYQSFCFIANRVQPGCFGLLADASRSSKFVLADESWLGPLLLPPSSPAEPLSAAHSALKPEPSLRHGQPSLQACVSHDAEMQEQSTNPSEFVLALGKPGEAHCGRGVNEALAVMSALGAHDIPSCVVGAKALVYYGAHRVPMVSKGPSINPALDG